MRLASLKNIRVVVSAAVFGLISFVFIDWGNVAPPFLRTFIVSMQLGPAVPKLFGALEIWSVAVGVVVLVTVLFGRVYCSSICPLGTFQDIIIRWSRRSRRRRWFRYRRAPYRLHYSLLGLTVILGVSGSMILVNALEPFSIFGRIVGGLARPILMTANNIGAMLLTSFDVYVLSGIPAPPLEYGLLAVPAVFLAAIAVLAFFRGRLFCNSVCPVGALLGLVSRIAIFRIVINHSTCKDCGLCEKVCKANCIDSAAKTVDFDACVSCFNCLEACPTVGLTYEGFHRRAANSAELPVDAGRRTFLQSFSAPLASLLVPLGRPDGVDSVAALRDAVERAGPVAPPGALGVARFSNLCTACHLCVSVCPTQVLQPSFLEYGLEGVFQPRMNYAVSYCNYDCVLCGEVCPSGAIVRVTLEDKKLTQIGKARFIKDDCIVITKKKDCAACAEHCPTKAVRMVPYENLRLPEVNNNICVGCGACEHACPVEPRRAILVESNRIHLRAEKPPPGAREAEPVKEGFPF